MKSIVFFITVFGICVLCEEQLKVESLVRGINKLLVEANNNGIINSNRSILFFDKDDANLDDFIIALSEYSRIEISENLNNIFPHYFHNGSMDLVLFACPIVRQISNINMELMASYFIANIAAKANEIKFVLIVKFDSLHDLKNIITALARLIVNPTKYQKSIIFIVKESPDTSDESKKIIGEYLQQLKINWIEAVEENGVNYQAMAQILDYILENQNDNIILSSSEVSSDLLQKIQKIEFTVTDEMDFSSRWNVAEESQKEIENVLQPIQNEFCRTTNQIQLPVKNYFETKIISGKLDLSQISNMFLDFNLKLQTLIEKAEVKVITPAQFINAILEFYPYTIQHKDELIVTKILQQILFWDLFSYFHSTTFESISLCVKNLAMAIQTDFVRPWSRWLEKMKEIDHALLDNEFQKSLKWMPSYRSWINVDFNRASSKNTTISISELIHIAHRLDVVIEDDLMTSVADDRLKMTLLYKMMKIRLTVQANVDCPKEANGTVLIIKDDIVTAFQIASILDLYTIRNSKTQLNSKDKTYLRALQGCSDILSSIEVIAFKKLIIDTNLKVNNASLSLIAPTWIVDGPRTIIMHGKDGEEYLEPAIGKDQSKADGKAGQAGQPAGAFLAISNNFENITTLTIHSEGGNGGNGQDGSIGLPGKDATGHIFVNNQSSLFAYVKIFHSDIDITPVTCNLLSSYYYILETNKGWLFFHGSNWDDSRRDTMVDEDYITYDFFNTEYVKIPDNSTKGGNGGNSGVGGSGGLPGIVKFFNFGDSITDVNVVQEFGSNGKCGEPGTGGRGGRSLSSTYCIYVKSKVQTTPTCNVYNCATNRVQQWIAPREINQKATEYIIGGLNINGKPGEQCASTAFKEQPASPSMKLVSIIERFKWIALKQMDMHFAGLELNQFLLNITNNAEFNEEYSAKEIIVALLSLEKRFSTFDKSDPKIIMLYEWLHARAMSLNENDLTTVFLKTALSTKVMEMNNLEHSHFIIDTKSYLENIIHTIEEHVKISDVIAIHKHKKDFTNILANKISDAYALVTEQVSSRIGRDFASLEKKLMDFLKKAEEKKNEIQEAVDNIKSQQKRMKQLQMFNIVFGVISLVSKVVALLGPVGAVVGGITDTLANLGTEFTNSEVAEAIPLHAELIHEKLTAVVEEAFDYKQSVLEKEAEILKQSLTDNRDDPIVEKLIGDIDICLGNIENEKNKENPNYKKISEEEQKLKDKVEKMNSRKETVGKALTRFKAGVGLVSAGANVYKQWSGDLNAYDALNKQIVEGEKAIEGIKKYREAIENTIGPLLQNMRDDFTRSVDNMKGSGKALLMVKNWNVRTVLTEVKIKLREILVVIDNYDVRDSVSSYIDLLEDTMNTVIKIYDQIETFAEQQKLVEFIADVNSARANAGTIGQLTGDARELYTIIKKNVVEIDYNAFINQFKQMVFPLAIYYLNDLDIVTSQNNYERYFDTYLTNLKKLNDRLNKYNAVINANIDNVKILASFKSRAGSEIKSFYTWKYEEHAETIQQLLRSNEVLLYADIHKSFMDMSNFRRDAIKFREVTLGFRTSNATEQHALEKLLSNVTIELTHMGNSYYKCARKVYLFASEPQKFTFSYSKEDAYFGLQSSTFAKIRSGNHILSPYALWKIRLSSESQKVNSQLKTIADTIAVDVELNGEGLFVLGDHRQDCEKFEISKFYGEHEVTDYISQTTFGQMRQSELTESDHLKKIVDNIKSLNHWPEEINDE